MNESKKHLESLLAKRLALDSAIISAQVKIRVEAAQLVKVALKEAGMTMTDFLARPKPRAKYGNEAGQTWCGIGRPPAWFRLALANGATPDDLRCREE